MGLIQSLGKQAADPAWSVDQNWNAGPWEVIFKCRRVVFRCCFSWLIVFQFAIPSHASACEAGAVAA